MSEAGSVPIPMPQCAGPLDDGGDEPVAIPDGHHRGDSHAPLAGRPVTGGYQRVGRRLRVGVGQDDGVVLGTAQRLDPLAGGCGRLVDVAGHRSRAHEAHRVDPGMGEQGIDRHRVTEDHREDALGQLGLAP